MLNHVYVIRVSNKETMSDYRREWNPVSDVLNNFTYSSLPISSKFTLRWKLERYPHLVGLVGIGILLCSVALSMLVTCIPHHNIILYPEYWYESMSTIISWVPCFAARNVIEARMLLQAQKILTWKSVLKHVLLISLGKVTSISTIQVIWTNFLSLRSPMPFHGDLTTLLTYLVHFPLSFWFLFPSNMRRKKTSTRKQILQYIQLITLRILVGIGYTKLPSIPLMKYGNLQWTLGILLPLLKKFNLWWHAKMVLKVSKDNKEVADVDTIISVGILHSFGLALLLGSSKISNITAYIIMISDFLLNAWSCRKIIKLDQQNTVMANECKDRSLKYLALKEFLEILVPAIYCLSFTAAFLGPNSDLIGNVKLDIWGHAEVSSLSDHLWNVVLFIIFDLVRAISIGIILWRLCKLNLYMAYCYIVTSYGWFILFYGITMINGVNGYYINILEKIYFLVFVSNNTVYIFKIYSNLFPYPFGMDQTTPTNLIGCQYR